MRQLFSHFTISIPGAELRDLLCRQGFESTEKRQKGKQSRSSDRRKGVAGDWVNHFDSEVKATFDDALGELPQELRYSSTDEVVSAV